MHIRLTNLDEFEDTVRFQPMARKRIHFNIGDEVYEDTYYNRNHHRNIKHNYDDTNGTEYDLLKDMRSVIRGKAIPELAQGSEKSDSEVMEMILGYIKRLYSILVNYPIEWEDHISHESVLPIIRMEYSKLLKDSALLAQESDSIKDKEEKCDKYKSDLYNLSSACLYELMLREE